MIPGFQYGFAKGQDSMWCIHRVGAKATMLCGRRIGHIPTPQPAARPTNVHQECVEAMYARGEQEVPSDEPGFGTCPACEGDAAVVDGLIDRHGEWRVGAAGPFVSPVRCPGEGLRPVEKR